MLVAICRQTGKSCPVGAQVCFWLSPCPGDANAKKGRQRRPSTASATGGCDRWDRERIAAGNWTCWFLLLASAAGAGRPGRPVGPTATSFLCPPRERRLERCRCCCRRRRSGYMRALTDDLLVAALIVSVLSGGGSARDFRIRDEPGQLHARGLARSKYYTYALGPSTSNLGARS